MAQKLEFLEKHFLQFFGIKTVFLGQNVLVLGDKMAKVFEKYSKETILIKTRK